jgi:hypothetical protein
VRCVQPVTRNRRHILDPAAKALAFAAFFFADFQGVRMQASPRSVRRFRFPLRALTCTLLLLLSGSAVAQQPGQWWWETAVGLNERDFENKIDGQPLSDFKEDSVELSFGLHGYIVHPALASFSVAVDALLSKVDARTDRDTNRYGLAADLNLIPQGAYPIRLYMKHGIYDYAQSADDDPFVRAGIPDTSTEWGAQTRIRKGPLTGVMAGLERTGIDYLSVDAKTGHGEREYLEWARGKRYRHRLRLEHRQRDYGTIDLGIEDFFANLDERAQISQSWRWEMFGRGLRRNLTVADGSTSTTDNLRLRNRLIHQLRANDLLDLRYTIGVTRFEDDLKIENHGVSAFYRWRLPAGVEIAPFASYQTQASAGYDVSSPRAGVSATWQKPFRTMQALLSARTSYGSIDYSGSSTDIDESQFAWGFNGSLTHGRSSGIRKELEFELSRDELRVTSVPTLSLPNLGLPRDGLGTENRYRSRLTVDHRWDGTFISASGEWTSSESSGSFAVGPFETTSLLGQVQFGTHGLGLSGTLGDTRVESQAMNEQDVEFVGVAATWTPRRYLSLRTFYRSDTRSLVTAPSIDGERYEVGVTMRFGQLVFDGFVYESEERLDGGSQRTHRGMTLSLSTRFAGALPIFTGTKRRGVIR